MKRKLLATALTFACLSSGNSASATQNSTVNESSLKEFSVPTAPDSEHTLAHQADQPDAIQLRVASRPSQLTRSEEGIELKYSIQTAADLENVRLDLGQYTDQVRDLDVSGTPLRDSNGRYLAMLALPILISETGEETSLRWVKKEDEITIASGNIPDFTSNSHVMVALGWTIVDRVDRSTWKNDDRYHVFPTSWGRTAPAQMHHDRGWSEATKKGVRYPTYGLKMQYMCHPATVVARGKSSWNLERARPQVNYYRMVRALCNP